MYRPFLHFNAMTKEDTKPTKSEYEAGLCRTGFAIKAELRPGLDTLIEASGARSFSALVAFMATEPQRAGALLAPLIKELTDRQLAADPVKSKKKRLEALADMTKGMSPEEIQAAMEAVRARKAAQ